MHLITWLNLSVRNSFIMRVIDHVLGQSSEALETKEREIRKLKEENKGLKEQIIEVCQNIPL